MGASRLLPLVLLGLGAIVLALAWRHASRGRETWSWSRATGRVIASRVERLDGPTEQGFPRFRPAVRYAYEARGARHEGDRVALGDDAAFPAADAAGAERVAAAFPEGSAVEVWYDPADPRRAVLRRGTGKGEVAALAAVGLALAGAGLFLAARMRPG